ncbi:transcriptional regulator [Paractinoplanes deccanensis]|uniref:Transcriptional regulator n=1 Tax=Paractinoplanes deccanensis TaxID=113561 RepID=A0ABQ3Y061_9ACTN|nr:Scr1 family TA system antitoxin-like transcriptional regulator [Actinoplanes deccanensis]GID73378.1 transcriptional regulator [Actinoplanes deccanensis]
MSNEFVRDNRLANTVGRALDELREAAGLSGKELAAATGLTQARISRVQAGQARPRPDEITRWLQACGAEARLDELLGLLADYVTWRSELDRRIRYGIAGDEIEYTATFKATKLIRTFAASEIPGYLQTEEYARQTIAAAAPEAPDDEREEAIKARLERGGYIGAREFRVVLAEAALRWLPVDPDTMRGQLGQLHTLAGKKDVTLGILPMGVRIPVAPRHGFTIHDDQFVVADIFGGAVLFRQQEPARYAGVMDTLMKYAVQGRAAQKLLTATMSAIPD